MKRYKSVLLIILTLVLLISVAAITTASECDVHSYALQEYGTAYFARTDGLTHHKYVMYDKVCIACGHKETADPVITIENHVYNVLGSYTGNNYHSGTRHYFEYQLKCVCGYSNGSTRWKSAYCAGGNHISPVSIQPIGETE